jgi:hypothetical protein
LSYGYHLLKARSQGSNSWDTKVPIHDTLVAYFLRHVFIHY